MNITIVAGARPNFIKIAPLLAEINKRIKENTDIAYRLVHTGQHYDKAMSGQFFNELKIPTPDINLNCGGGTQAEQTAQILVAFEKELLENPTDLVMVVGDVNSTMACCISAKKLNIPVAHIEAGIRSYDMSMPEEINRIVTDSISDYFFTTSRWASDNLYKINKSQNQVFFVGNVMIDTLLSMKPHFKAPNFYATSELEKNSYIVLTLHRPSNVDDSVALHKLIQFICKKVGSIKVIFPMHPRTRKNFNTHNIPSNLLIVPPQGYLNFNYLIQNALGVLTDSGGITEETTVMNIPCISLRNTTERPETITHGTNVLAGNDYNIIERYLEKMLSGNWHQSTVPELWDGKASERIVQNLLALYESTPSPKNSHQ